MELNEVRSVYSYRNIEALFAFAICAKNNKTFDYIKEAYKLDLTHPVVTNMFLRNSGLKYMQSYSKYAYEYFKDVLKQNTDTAYFEVGMRYMFRADFFLRFTSYDARYFYYKRKLINTPTMLPLSYPLLLEDIFFEQDFENSDQLEKFIAYRIDKHNTPIGDGNKRINIAVCMKAIYYNRDCFIDDTKSFMKTFISIYEKGISKNDFSKVLSLIKTADEISLKNIEFMNAIAARKRYDDKLASARAHTAEKRKKEEERLACMSEEELKREKERVDAKKKKQQERAAATRKYNKKQKRLKEEETRINHLFKDCYYDKYWDDKRDCLPFFEGVIIHAFYLLYLHRTSKASIEDIVAFFELHRDHVNADALMNFIKYAEAKEPLLSQTAEMIDLSDIIKSDNVGSFMIENDAAFLFDFPMLYAMYTRNITYENLVKLSNTDTTDFLSIVYPSKEWLRWMENIINAYKTDPNIIHLQAERVKKQCLNILKTGRINGLNQS